VTAAPLDEARLLLRRVFGFSGFRPGQEEIVSHLLAGRDVLALMPTGGGKSLTYQLAALTRPGLGLVVSPLKALMQDQVRQLRSLGIEAATVQSGTTHAAKREVWQGVTSGRLKLLYVSPELLLKDDGRLLDALARVPLSVIAIDEAHTVSHWGHDFREAYRGLGTLRVRFAGVPMAALTATADGETCEDVMRVLFGGPVPVVRRSFDRPNLRLRVVEREDAEMQLAQLVAGYQGQAGIIYVRTRDQADATAAALSRAGRPALAYHAGMEEAARTRVMDRFVTDPAPLVVGTVAFGMGIDRPDVRFVLHRDLPSTPESYYQEIGRAGRDGAPADTVLLYAFQDIPKRRSMIEASDAADSFKRLQQRRLDALVAVVEATVCRKQALVRYFGEAILPCGCCDVCLDPPELVDATRPAKALFRAVAGLGERFGRSHVIDVLRGAGTIKIRDWRHDRLDVYGTGRDLDARAWQMLVRQLYGSGHLTVDAERHGALRLTELAKAVLDGGAEVRCALKPRKVQARPTAPASAAPFQALQGPEAELFQLLRERRAALARERGGPAYLVFSDRTLLDMVRRRPTSMAAMAEVDGVGPAKLETFGAAFLEVLRGLAADGGLRRPDGRGPIRESSI